MKARSLTEDLGCARQRVQELETLFSLDQEKTKALAEKHGRATLLETLQCQHRQEQEASTEALIAFETDREALQSR
jgi:hypothetical protein